MLRLQRVPLLDVHPQKVLKLLLVCEVINQKVGQINATTFIVTFSRLSEKYIYNGGFA